jgi:hypothetical protein
LPLFLAFISGIVSVAAAIKAPLLWREPTSEIATFEFVESSSQGKEKGECAVIAAIHNRSDRPLLLRKDQTVRVSVRLSRVDDGEIVGPPRRIYTAAVVGLHNLEKSETLVAGKESGLVRTGPLKQIIPPLRNVAEANSHTLNLSESSFVTAELKAYIPRLGAPSITSEPVRVAARTLRTCPPNLFRVGRG